MSLLTQAPADTLCMCDSLMLTRMNPAGVLLPGKTRQQRVWAIPRGTRIFTRVCLGEAPSDSVGCSVFSDVCIS